MDCVGKEEKEEGWWVRGYKEKNRNGSRVIKREERKEKLGGIRIVFGQVRHGGERTKWDSLIGPSKTKSRLGVLESFLYRTSRLRGLVKSPSRPSFPEYSGSTTSTHMGCPGRGHSKVVGSVTSV